MNDSEEKLREKVHNAFSDVQITEMIFMCFTQSNDLFPSREPPKGHKEWNGTAILDYYRHGTIFVNLQTECECYSSSKRKVEVVKPVICQVINKQGSVEGILVMVYIHMYMKLQHTSSCLTVSKSLFG